LPRKLQIHDVNCISAIYAISQVKPRSTALKLAL